MHFFFVGMIVFLRKKRRWIVDENCDHIEREKKKKNYLNTEEGVEAFGWCQGRMNW